MQRMFVRHLVLGSSFLLYALSVCAAGTEALDLADMNLNPIIEIKIPADKQADNRLAVITNHEGWVIGLGFHGSYGTADSAGGDQLRANLAEIQNKKILRIGKGTPFLTLDGKFFGPRGGVVTLSAPDGNFPIVINIKQERGVWEAHKLHLENRDFIDEGIVNTATITADYNIFKRRVVITAIVASYDVHSRERWESMQQQSGYFPNFQSRPSQPSPPTADLP